MNWEGKVVLITGSEGFIGRHLAVRLREVDAVVRGFDLLVNVRNDLRDIRAIRDALAYVQPEYIFHLAANSIVENAQANPRSSFEMNVAGTWNLLECLRERVGKGTVGIVVSSSNHVYGQQKVYPSREDAPLNHTSVYSTTKIMVDYLSRCYAAEYGLPVVTIRHTNIYGPQDPHGSHLITGSIRSMLAEQRPSLRTLGTTRKGYLYVDDAVDAYILLAERAGDHAGRAFNCSSEQRYSALDILRTLRSVMGKDLEPITGEQPGEPDEMLDSTAIRKLGWQQRVSLEEGLRLTIESMRQEKVTA